ncbi:unnamed protein product [Adineta steineri]|uniref:Uncharacterized protein n=2 Tax=Adineta steineri TaxID=433720 RepID=A0A814L2T9_9BILA|nr:unnamed protein product [Adineta steineri]
MLANTYNRFKLIFDSESPYNVKSIPFFVQPENVTTLILSNDYLKTDRIKAFISIFNISQFTRLHSLSLHQIQDDDLEHVLEHMNTDYLSSLFIESSHSENCSAWALGSSLLKRCSLRKLSMHNINYTMEHILWPDQCKLQHLVIDSCIYREYLDILQKLPYLRTLVMRNCTIDDTHSTLLLLYKFKTPSSLISLTISDCSFSLKNLTLLLSPIPTLLHLKLISHRSILDSFFHGSRLEELIRAKAPALVRFEFFLSYKYQENDRFISLESLMDPFRTSFWLNDKRWFVTCAYVPKGSTIWLHTTPIRDSGIEKLVRCEVSCIDKQCRLTQRSIDEIIDNTDDVTLTTFGLYYNQIGDRGAQYLVDILQQNKVSSLFYRFLHFCI